MRLRFGAAGAVAVVCVAVGLLLVSTATSRAPASAKSKPVALREAKQRGSLVHGVNGDELQGRVTNLTPYTWTLVGSGTNVNPDARDLYRWNSKFPATVDPGSKFTYSLSPWSGYSSTRRYDGWFTYRADTVSGTEYLTVNFLGNKCTVVCFGPNGPNGPALNLVPGVWNGSSLPRDVDRRRMDFGPGTANPEIGWTAGGNDSIWPGITIPFDFTFQTKGNYSIDASKDPALLSSMLKSLCADGSGTKCSFTTDGAIQWKTGALDQQTSVKSCGAAPPARTRRVLGNPPQDSPDWHDVSVSAKRTRSVSVGGSLTGTASVGLFDVIDAEVSVKIGLEHEWSETRDFEKTTRIYVPQDWIAGVWIAPVEGNVTGTLVVTTALATYTITNFRETASGVSKDLTTPAFDIMTYARKMTPEEYQRLCNRHSSRLRRPSQ